MQKQIHGGFFDPMSGSDGYDYTAFVIGLAVIIGVIGFAVHGSNEPSEKRSAYYYEECSASSLYRLPIEQASPSNQSPAQGQDSERNEPDWCDLAAQQAVAEAANGAELAAWVTAGITSLGLILLGYTLFYTRRTLDESSRAANAAVKANALIQAQQRPWLTIDREIDGFLTMTLNPNDPTDEFPYTAQARIIWTYHPKNVGRSPGFGMHTRQKLVCEGDYLKRVRRFDEFCDNPELQWLTNSEKTVFPGERREFNPSSMWAWLDAAPGPQTPLCLFFALAYRSQESDIFGLEARLFHVQADFTTQGPWPVRILEDSSMRVTR